MTGDAVRRVGAGYGGRSRPGGTRDRTCAHRRRRSRGWREQDRGVVRVQQSGSARPETASRIRDIAEQLGYTPHPVARMLTQRQTMTIGVLTPQALSVIFSNPFFGAFAEGVALVAEEYGYGLHFISPVHGQPRPGDEPGDGRRRSSPSASRRRAPGGRADPPSRRPDRPGRLDGPAGARQRRDRRRGRGRAAAEHIAALGHRDILIIGVEPPVPGWPGSGRRDRAAPARVPRGLRALRRRTSPTSDWSRPASIEGGVAALLRAWEEGLRSTAVLAMSDVIAIGAMRALRDLRIDVPSDVSVVGFDDIDLAPHVDPPADDGAPADPSQGRGGRAPVAVRRRTTGSIHSGGSAVGDPTHRSGLDRTGAQSPRGGGPGP